MFIRNLTFDADKHYKCNRKIAKYLIDKGFSEISSEEDMVIFINTQELKAALKAMPFHLKFITMLGGDSDAK